MICIYDYIDPKIYLQDIYLEKKKSNPSFSIRAWAKFLKMKHHNPLQEMLKGKRKIAKAYVPHFIKTLELTIDEGFYFDTLVSLQRAKANEEKELYLERLRSLSPRQSLSMFEVEAYRSIKDPLHVIITELSALKGFQNDARWIQKRLGFKKTISEIENAIERLIGLGLMKEDQNGNLVKIHDHIYSKVDGIDTGLQEYHQNVMELASKAITVQDPKEREYNAYCINIEKEKIPEMKKAIRRFMHDFATKFEAKSGTAENTYQLNTQFFNLTDTIDTQEKK